MTLPVNKIICGDAKTELAKLPEGSINCCISSPPYWALRDYGVDGQLGLEKTFEQYIDDLCSIYDEVKRVLRPDGTCFVNLGDTYSAKGTGGGQSNQSANEGKKCDGFRSNKYLNQDKIDTTHLAPEKSLCLIPQRFAIEMVNRGWILRNVVIWHKPNPMPSSAKDRFTVDFEYVYFFVKNKRYWFEPQYEQLQQATVDRVKYPHHTKGSKAESGNYSYAPDFEYGDYSLGRNKRTVWTMAKEEFLEWMADVYEVWQQLLAQYGTVTWKIATEAFSEAHFATFPRALVRPMILSGCPEFVCKKCGEGRRKVYEKSGGTTGQSWHDHNDDIGAGIRQTSNGVPLATAKGRKEKENPYQVNFKGYTDCGCNAGWRPGVTLDPFAVAARPVWSPPKTEGTGLELNLTRSISKWHYAA